MSRAIVGEVDAQETEWLRNGCSEAPVSMDAQPTLAANREAQWARRVVGVIRTRWCFLRTKFK